MKKILLSAVMLSLFAGGLVGCMQQKQWDMDQRKAMREALRGYRQMVYLSDLTSDEFVLFADNVANSLEDVYPVYTSFLSMPGVTDTVNTVVVTTIVEELNADARNMRHIYPYNYLVGEGVLPAGLTHEQQHSFYKCFAGKVDSSYSDLTQFLNAIISDTTSLSNIHQMQLQCANDLFEWVVTEVEVTETTN